MKEKKIHGYSAHLFSEESLKKAAKMLKRKEAFVCLAGMEDPWWMLHIAATGVDCNQEAVIAIGDFRKLYNQRAPLKGIKSLEKQYKKVVGGSKKKGKK